MKRITSSVLALAMVAALLAIFAGAASAADTDKGQIAAINGVSTAPVAAATANGDPIGGPLDYAGDAQAAIFAAGQYDVAFDGASQATVTLAGMDAFTVVSGFGVAPETAKAYPVDVTPIASGKGKIQVWNATSNPITANTGSGDQPVDPGESLNPAGAVEVDPGDYVVTIDGTLTRIVTVDADSYTDVFAVNDGTTPAIAIAAIASMTDLIAALTAAPGGVAVPDVVGQLEADATTAITDAGLVAAATQAPDDTVPAGNVVSQDPVAGTDVPTGSTVSIVVSTGPDNPNTPVPDVAGKAAADAQAELEAAGFTVATEEQSSMDVEAGLVIETNPSAGTEVAAGTEVKMIVSSGAGEIIVPNFVGMTQDDATKAAEEVGLTIKFVEDADNPDPEGLVASQDPTAGAKAEAGSEVVAQLTPKVDDAWSILTLSPNRILTVSGINFKPGTTVDLDVLNTDKKATATVQSDGSWVTTADLSDVQNEAELLLVKGTAADESAYEATFKIPAAGESTDEPTDEVPTEDEEETSGTPVWVWVILGLLVIAIIALVVKMFGGGDTTDGDDTPETGGDDAPATDTPTADNN